MLGNVLLSITIILDFKDTCMLSVPCQLVASCGSDLFLIDMLCKNIRF